MLCVLGLSNKKSDFKFLVVCRFKNKNKNLNAKIFIPQKIMSI